MSTYHGLLSVLHKCLNSVLNVEALIGQEKAPTRAVIVKTDGSFAALLLTQSNTGGHCIGGTMTSRVHLVLPPTKRYDFIYGN